ncbi:effector-associated constant component EACC1 [Streptomyces yaizuensis]|uniref:STAS domain-containing protein n=1 Tax=Streptomyces yaizuensis TaxID=2989713 RepID=A0ABQ5NS09_9ACTN|nr:hypothetical protein [Streptomyces sp. YSPA8]GLF93168.1 hypothetical protein SYYSPA8_02745 [Streptomyces sp. YSPA8]
MRIQISAPGGGDGAVADLHRWLRLDDEVRRDTRIRLTHRPAPGTMGTVDIIDLVVGQSVAVLNLALSYAAWRAARRTAPPVTLTTPGATVTLTGASDDEIRRLVHLLNTRPPAEPTPPTPPDPPRQDAEDRPGPGAR